MDRLCPSKSFLGTYLVKVLFTRYYCFVYVTVRSETVKVEQIATSKMAAKFEIQKFNGSNFSLWKMKIKAVLRKDNCLAAIDKRPKGITNAKWEETDGNVVANLHLALADEVLSSIAEKKSAKEIWDMLTKLYEVKSLHTKIFLKRKLYTLRMAESTSVTDHINTLNNIFTIHFIESDNSRK